MRKIDLAISYIWKFDLEFVTLIEDIFQKSGLSTFVITKQNLEEVLILLKKKKLAFKAYLDRASDEDQKFKSITKILNRKDVFIINPHPITCKVINKFYFHKKLSKKHFTVPKTILISSLSKNKSVRISDEQLNLLGIPFIIKPAQFSGGGHGVIKNGITKDQLLEEMNKNPNEDYLIQEKIHPIKNCGRKAWFRIFWAFGKIIPTWWDDQTHIYHILTTDEIEKYKLHKLIKIVQRLARLSKLDYFSSEIAVTKDHRFILIDYINDQCDMRLQSKHIDGVPDRVVIEFIAQMKNKINSF